MFNTGLTRKMFTKCMILVLVMASWQNAASPHILTSIYPKLPLPNCMKHLPKIVTKFLCTESDDVLSEYFDDISVPNLKRWNSEEVTFQICCTRPCTLKELLSLC